MKRQKTIATFSHLLSRIFNVHAQGLYLLMLLFPLCASAQSLEPVTITKDTRIKVKLTRGLVSGRVRIGDYIPLEVAEDVLVPVSPGGRLVAAITKGTPVFGIVVERKHRLLFFRSGKFAVRLDNVRTVEGTDVPVSITRRNKESYCKDKTPEKLGQTVHCITGRTYSGVFTNTLPAAIAAATTATTLILVKDPTAKAVAAVTLAGQVATQPGLSTILNGVDAEMDNGEIFDAVVAEPRTIKVKVPAP